MNHSILKKGWCPSLEKPMQTGDGLLVRLYRNEGFITAEQGGAIAALAIKYGNGNIDLTSRGNLQFRGVTEETYPLLHDELIACGLVEEPRPPRNNDQSAPALGYIADRAEIALGLPFGRVEATQFAWLADIAGRYADGLIHLTPWRVLQLKSIAPDVAKDILETAAAQGFLIHSDDPLRSIHACVGAPACSSAQGDTRGLAKKIAQLGVKKDIHISGCAKGCSYANRADITVVADEGKYNIAYGAKASDAPQYKALSIDEVITRVSHERL